MVPKRTINYLAKTLHLKRKIPRLSDLPDVPYDLRNYFEEGGTRRGLNKKGSLELRQAYISFTLENKISPWRVLALEDLLYA
jgi:hypothetical protein